MERKNFDLDAMEILAKEPTLLRKIIINYRETSGMLLTGAAQKGTECRKIEDGEQGQLQNKCHIATVGSWMYNKAPTKFQAHGHSLRSFHKWVK